jgi:hypothetical protein
MHDSSMRSSAYYSGYCKSYSLDVLKEKAMFYTFAEDETSAHAIIDSMRSIIYANGYITVADLEKAGGMTFHTSIDKNTHGWREAKYEWCKAQYTGEYVIVLPEPEDLERRQPPKVDLDPPCEDKMVSHPPHYQSETGLEAIDVIEAFTFDLKGIEATDTGNVLKYMCRWKSKNGLQDLKKAKWYLDHLINHVEKIREGE